MNTEQITGVVINALEDVKGDNIVVINTGHISSMFNAIVVCSGTSSRQIAALAHNVIEDLKTSGITIIGTEGKRGGEWVLVDAGDVVVHIMLPKVREYYSIEALWNREDQDK